MKGRKEKRPHNSGFKKLAVQWLQEVQFSNETFVVADSLRLRNRQLLKPTKRKASCFTSYPGNNGQTINFRKTNKQAPKKKEFELLKGALLQN